MKRALRHRYGGSRAHLPRSGDDLVGYERKVRESMRWLRLPTSLVGRTGDLGTEMRMLILDGWHQGRKPITTALYMERAWRESKRNA